MKGLEIASLIAAPIVSHWCNASLIVIADVVIGSFVPTFAVLSLLAYAFQGERNDDQHSVRLPRGSVVTNSNGCHHRDSSSSSLSKLPVVWCYRSCER